MKTRFGDVEQFVTELRMIGDTSATPEPGAALHAVLEGGRTPRANAVAATRRRWLRPVVLPATVATVLFGGLAAAGALPAPVQRATAGFATHLGVSIPGHTTRGHRSSPAPGPSVRANGGVSTAAHTGSSSARPAGGTHSSSSGAATPPANAQAKPSRPQGSTPL